MTGVIICYFNIDKPVKSPNGTLVCHSRESENPLFQTLTSSWIPARGNDNYLRSHPFWKVFKFI